MRFSINHWAESQNTLVVALIMSVTDRVTLDKSPHFCVFISSFALYACWPCCTPQQKIIPIWNLLETALLQIMPGMHLYFSPFPNTCHILKTNVTQKKNKITSLILKSTYAVLTISFKSAVLLLKSSCGEGIQLEGTCGCPLPMGTRKTPSPAQGFGDALPRFCQCCTHKREKLCSAG